MARAGRIIAGADVARNSKDQRVTCPDCGHQVVRWTYIEIRAVKRNGCGCPQSSRRKMRQDVARDPRPCNKARWR